MFFDRTAEFFFNNAHFHFFSFHLFAVLRQQRSGIVERMTFFPRVLYYCSHFYCPLYSIMCCGLFHVSRSCAIEPWRVFLFDLLAPFSFSLRLCREGVKSSKRGLAGRIILGGGGLPLRSERGFSRGGVDKRDHPFPLPRGGGGEGRPGRHEQRLGEIF